MIREFSCLEQAPKAFDWQREVGSWQGFLREAGILPGDPAHSKHNPPYSLSFQAKALGGRPPCSSKPLPQSSALRLCRPPLALRPFHFALLRYKGGDTPQPALATPRLRQVAFRHLVEMPTTKSKTRSNAMTINPDHTQELTDKINEADHRTLRGD